MEHYYAVILAGGGGTRLWPMSRAELPKQLLPLIEDTSMFHVSIERLAPLFPPDHVYVVTGERFAEMMMADASEIPRENFIVEPEGRNTGPAAALAVTTISKRDPEATVALLTSDHHIAYKERFRSVLASAHTVAQEGFIVTLGISPSMPSTGFGYIRRGELMREVDGFECYHSLNFTEKPDAQTARHFLRSGEYSWNSGMFIWRADLALSEFQRQQPAIYDLMMTYQQHVDSPDAQAKLVELWAQMPKIQLDTGVMEGAERIAVIPVDIGWSDVGSWDALFDVLDLDVDGNGFRGASPNRIVFDTRNSLVYSDKLTVTIGIEDLVVVDTDDVLMICHKDRAQDVRKVVDLLREMEQVDYL
ncbi:MAG: mannose-1-phosphate guanylyltransferase [Chloroflexi bacterium]|nr:mannose-1-phosphate guanylyltransferase [Chloroflexota bacterium]